MDFTSFRILPSTKPKKRHVALYFSCIYIIIYEYSYDKILFIETTNLH
jgi:hypothetical protein